MPIAVAGLVTFLASAGVVRFYGRLDPLIGWFPVLLILLCPLMHILMHRRHGGHSHSTEAGGEPGAALTSARSPRRQQDRRTIEDQGFRLTVLPSRVFPFGWPFESSGCNLSLEGDGR